MVFPSTIFSSIKIQIAALYNKTSNKNWEILSDSPHITLPRKHDRFIIQTHLGGITNENFAGKSVGNTLILIEERFCIVLIGTWGCVAYVILYGAALL